MPKLMHNVKQLNWQLKKLGFALLGLLLALVDLSLQWVRMVVLVRQAMSLLLSFRLFVTGSFNKLVLKA
jgi:hypothetical protein